MKRKINSEREIVPKKKYKCYNNLDLELAVRESIDGPLTLYAAAKKYKIPVKTLDYQIKIRQTEPEFKKRGASMYLNEDEEKELEIWILLNARVGDPKTKDEILNIASEIRNLREKKLGIQNLSRPPSSFWMHSYLKRHQRLTFRKPERLSPAAANITEGLIRQFFTNIYDGFEIQGLLEVLERPEAIINLDESGFELNPVLMKGCTDKSSNECVRIDSSKGKETITTTFAFSANGRILPTQVLLKSKCSRVIDTGIAIGRCNADFVLDHSESGWQTKETFSNYLKHLIYTLESDEIAKPYIIYYDNHSSHLNYELFRWCVDREVHVVTFPPNTTHILQACDVGIFGPTKAGWRKELTLYRKQNGLEMNEPEFVTVLKKTIDRVITKEKVIKAFESTGIYPFNIEKVNFEKCIAQDNQEHFLGEYQFN